MDTETVTTCPVAQFRGMRERGPVIEAPGLGEGTTLMVTGHDDVRAMLTDPRLRNDAGTVPGAAPMIQDLMARVGIPPDLEILSQGLLTRDGADHARLRRLVSRAFTVRRVGELRPRVEALTESLLDDVAAAGADGRPVDLVPAFTYALPVAVICELVGVPEHLRGPWRELAGLLVALEPDRVPGPARAVVAQLRDLIAERRREPADDLLTALVEAHDDAIDPAERSEGHPSAAVDPGRLTEDEILILVFDILTAGFETTAHLLAKSILALLTRPEQLAALRADPDLWPHAVHELVRLCGPIPTSLPRYAAEDTEIAGTPVPQGTAVMAALLSANTDPRTYDHPEELDVRRRPAGRGDGHVGFGQGPHYCLGAALARQETEVALRALVGRFDGLRLATDGPHEPSDLGFVRLPDLLVRVDGRTPPLG